MQTKSALDKFLTKVQAKQKRKLRKAITGSSDSLKVQNAKRVRKALTGSSQRYETQLAKKAGCGVRPIALFAALWRMMR